MSNTNEQLVHNKTGKFVTFSEDCDNDKKSLHDKYVEAGIVVPKTRVSESIVDNIFRNDWTPIRFPQPAEIILPFSKNKNKIVRRNRESDKFLLMKSMKCMSNSGNTIQMNAICKKLKRIHQLKQMDDLTALCKEKMSISTKDSEKMDEDEILDEID